MFATVCSDYVMGPKTALSLVPRPCDCPSPLRHRAASYVLTPSHTPSAQRRLLRCRRPGGRRPQQWHGHEHGRRNGLVGRPNDSLAALHTWRHPLVLWLVPSSTGAMVGTCIGLFLLALVDRWIAACRAVMEVHWSKRYVFPSLNSSFPLRTKSSMVVPRMLLLELCRDYHPSSVRLD